MIIVSQDKRKIVNFDNLFNIDYYKIDGNFEIDANTDKDSISLGYYKTEERAKEVLQEIIIAYQTTEICYRGQVNYNPINSIHRPIYEMPVEKVDDK